VSDFHRVAFAVLLLLCTSAVLWGDSTFEYPSWMLHAYDADGSCWRGMDAYGQWQGAGIEPGVAVVPELWLVGPPPSDLSAVTIPEDHWLHLIFSGRIADGTGGDIVLLESGMMGEQALVFLTDGGGQEYPIGLAVAQSTGQQAPSRIEIDLARNPSPFVARGVRVVGVDMGGGSPGFDLSSVQARVSHDCGPAAQFPVPPCGAVDIVPGTQLSWTPPCTGAEQRIYFGEVQSQVSSGAAQALCAILPADANTFLPPQVGPGRTYYWRVGAVLPTNPNLSYPGDVWTFATSDHLVIDNFETYVATGSLADFWECWGWSNVFLQEANSQTCEYVMDFRYYYDQGSYSQVSRRFDEPQDWMRADAGVLQLLISGDLPDPATGEMYVSVTDDIHEQFVLYAGPASIADYPDGYPWQIALVSFNLIDLTQVRGIAIGVRPRSFQPGVWRRGTIGIRDISVYPALRPEDGRLAGDLNGDCTVDAADLERMAADWLRPRVRTYAVAEPNKPLLWYTFDGDAHDSAGSGHGQTYGRVAYEPGAHGQAIRFTYQGDGVRILDAPSVFAHITDAITIAFWQYGDDSPHLNDTICCSNYQYGKSNPAISITLGCWEDPGQYRWDCGSPWSLENRLAGYHRDRAEWAGRWNHWVFIKDIRPGPDGRTGRMEIYLNGVLYDSRTGADSPITGITSFDIGTGWYGRYDGLIDDFQIYDYALSPAEVVWLATDSSGEVEDFIPSPANLNATGRVDLRDFALLATQWRESSLRP
jgi:hypothetical protein